MTAQYNKQGINSPGSSPTIHFNIGNVGAPTLAPVPGTADPDAMSVFGQLNVYEQLVIDVVHLHQILDGSAGATTIELWRRRGGVLSQICTVSLPFGSGDFATAFAVPVGDLKVLEAGDYLYCQATAIQTNADGITIDVHFNRASRGG